MKLAEALALVGPYREPITFEIGQAQVTVGLQILGIADEVAALARARSYAVEHGVTDPSETDPLYEQGLAIATVALACVEHDSPRDAPVRVFESEEALVQNKLVPRELVAYLYARYRFMVDTHSPRKFDVTRDQIFAMVKSAQEDDPIPFCDSRAGIQWLSFRFLAVLLGDSLEERFSSFERFFPKTSSTQARPTH